MGAPLRTRLLATSLGLLVVSAAVDLSAQPAPAAPAKPPGEIRYEAAGTEIVIVAVDGSKRSAPLGCPTRGLVVHDGRVHVACGPAGVVVLAPTPDGGLQPVGQVPFDGEVTAVFVHEGRVWAQVQRLEARPVSVAAQPVAPAPSAAAGPWIPSGPWPEPAPAAAGSGKGPQPSGAPGISPRRLGRVVATEPGEIVVDLGQEDGVTVDARIRLIARQSREMGTGHVTWVEEKLAVGEVLEVAPDRARVRLGVNEDVPLGTMAQLTDDELTSSLIAPPRPGGQWHLGLMARPYLALGDLAFGLLSTVEVGYRGEDNWHVRALGEPLGFTVGKGASVGAVSAVAAGSYDHELFEVGAGLGATRVANYPTSGVGPKMAFTLMPLARLGALDGFHVEVHNGFVIAAEKFRYGSTSGTIQIPLARPVALALRGGGGISGYAFGEIALRVLAMGNGGQGTVFAIPSVGAAFMFGEYDCDGKHCSDRFFGGPMVGLGFEWRP